MDTLENIKAQFLDSLALFRKHWKVLAITLLLAWLPLWIFRLAATFVLERLTDLSQAGLAVGGALGVLVAAVLRLGVSLLIELPLFFLACALSQGVTVVQLLALENGSILSPLDAWRAMRPNMTALLVTSALAVTVITLGFFFFLVPGGILMFYLQLAAPLTMIEDKRGLSALKESFALIHRAPRGFIVLLVGAGIVSSIAKILAGTLLPSGLASLGGNLIFMAVYPLEGFLLIRLYRDIRAKERRESGEPPLSSVSLSET